MPYKGSLPTAIPTDPLIYRWYEIVNVYGSTIKELIHEEFGDGIMSAIDFSMDISREPTPRATACTSCCRENSCPTRPTDDRGVRSGELAGDPSRRPRPLEVVAAQPPRDIHAFADEIKAGRGFGLHGF
ncbi:MAG: hypothetical protein WDN04_01240 [Rhodospirillales bacterium]